MLGFLKSLFQPQPSSETAKERLKVVLLSDHLSLAPDVVDALRADLLAVISKYVEFDERNAEVTFEQRESDVALSASVPILAVKTERTTTYRSASETGTLLAQTLEEQASPLLPAAVPPKSSVASPLASVETGTIPQTGSRRRRKRRNRRLAQLQVASTTVVPAPSSTPVVQENPTSKPEPLRV